MFRKSAWYVVLALVCSSVLAGCPFAYKTAIAPAPLDQGWVSEKATFNKTVHYGTTRIDKCETSGQAVCRTMPDRFDTGNEATAEQIKYGAAIVKIPYAKKIGGIEGMSLLRLNDLDREAFKRNISSDDIFIFIHGFNNGFQEAAARCAQLAFDLNFQGKAVFFSWPAGTETLGYDKDKRRADENVTHLHQFLSNIAESTDKKIHIIAHSMGNYLLVKTLSEMDARIATNDTFLLKRRTKHGGKLFNQIVLAAPDVAQDTFRPLFAEHLRKLADNYTLYSTYNDLALRLSRGINFLIEKDGTYRLGDSHADFFTIDGLDTVDARLEVGTQVFGHSYYANYPLLITDMYLLFNYGARPENRFLLKVQDDRNQLLWFLRPD